MIKIFGYGDKIRSNIQEKTLELLDKNDYRTSWDINRPIENLFEEVESLYQFVSAFGKHRLTSEGVFSGSLIHEFNITSSDIQKIRLYDKRDLLHVTFIDKVYARLKPGIAGVYHSDSRQDSIIVVHKPSVRFFERQVAEILQLFYHNAKEGVYVKYNNINHTYKAKIVKILHPTQNPISFYFGCSNENEFNDNNVTGVTAQILIQDIYNKDELNSFFVNTLNGKIENLILEPIFEVKTIGKKYWNIVNGEVVLNDEANKNGFDIGNFTVSSLNPLTITNISNEHRKYGKNIVESIYGDYDDSYKLETNGGVEYNIYKGLKFSFNSGALFEINQNGDVTLTSLEKNENITNNIETIVTDTKNITNSTETVTNKKTINANTELELNGALLDVNNTEQTFDANNQTNTIANQTNNITTKNDTIGTETQNIIENRTISIGLNNTESVTETNILNAKKQRINAIEDIILQAPTITLKAEGGTINLIGENQIVEGTTVRLEDTVVELNKNFTGTPINGVEYGFEINRGTQDKAKILFRESDDTWVTGIGTDIKALANREDDSVIVDTAIPFWNYTEKKFKTDSKLKYNKDKGTVTLDTDNVTSTPPISTNSTAKVANLNVDKVDGVDISNLGAASGEIALWSGTNTIATSNKVFSTDGALYSNSDSNIPTEKAVKTYVDSHINTVSDVHGATSDNIADQIVKRNSSGDFTAGVITANLNGRANVANLADKLTIARTISLSGVASGSASFDGSQNVSINVSVTRVSADSGSAGIMNQNGYTKSPGHFYGGTNAPTSSNRLNYDGYFFATRVYNAIYNDLAEFMPKAKECKPGMVLIQTEYGLAPCKKRGDKAVVGVYSDSYGFILGGSEDEYGKVPVGITGRVCVWIEEPCKIGDLLITSDKEGFASVLKDEENGTGKVFGKVLKNKYNNEPERIEMLIINA